MSISASTATGRSGTRESQETKTNMPPSPRSTSEQKTEEIFNSTRINAGLLEPKPHFEMKTISKKAIDENYRSKLEKHIQSDIWKILKNKKLEFQTNLYICNANAEQNETYNEVTIADRDAPTVEIVTAFGPTRLKLFICESSFEVKLELRTLPIAYYSPLGLSRLIVHCKDQKIVDQDVKLDPSKSASSKERETQLLNFLQNTQVSLNSNNPNYYL